MPLTLDLSEIAEGELLRELDRRGKLPRVDLAVADDAELYSELGRRRQAKRKVHRGGTGRPPKPEVRVRKADPGRGGAGRAWVRVGLLYAAARIKPNAAGSTLSPD